MKKVLLFIFLFIRQVGFAQVDWHNPSSLFGSVFQPDAEPETGPIFDARTDASGVLHVVWVAAGNNGPGRLYHSALKNGQFSPPVRVSAASIRSAVTPQLHRRPSGTMALVWVEFNSSTAKIYFSELGTDDKWSKPEQISGPLDFSVFPVISAISDQRLVVAYSEISLDTLTVTVKSNVILKERLGNGTWEKIPFPADSTAYRPALFYSSGKLHAAWFAGGDQRTVPANNYVAYAIFENGQWGEVRILSNSISQQISDDEAIYIIGQASGEVALLWSSFIPFERQMMINPPQGQATSMPFDINRQASALFDQNGILHILADEDEGKPLHYAYFKDGVWSQKTQIEMVAMNT